MNQKSARKLNLTTPVFVVLASSILVLGNFPTLFTPSQVLAQSSLDKQTEAQRILEQGIQQFQASQFQEALKSWEQALQIYRQINNRKGEGTILGNQAIVYYSVGDYTKAIDLLQQHLAIARQIGDREGEGRALGNLGLTYYELGDYRKSIDLSQQHLVIAKQMGDRAAQNAALGNMGLAYNSLGDYKKAIELFEQDLAISQQIGDRASAGKTLANLGISYSELGEYNKAIEFYQQSLAIAREFKNSVSIAKVLGNMGIAYENLGNYKKAIELQQERLAISQQIGDRGGEGAALNNLGNVYSNQGEYKKAIDFYQQSLAITKQIGERRSVGTSLGNIGKAYNHLGDYKKAIEFQQQSLAIAKQIGDRAGESRALGHLGNAYSELVNFSKAIEFQQQSLVIARQIGYRAGESGALTGLGSIYNSVEDYKKAIDFFQQALAIDKQIGDGAGVGKALGNLGNAYRSLGDYKKAIDFYQQALTILTQIGDKGSVGLTLANLGNAQNYLGDNKKAIESQQQALKILRQVGDSRGEGGVLNNLGFTLFQSGNLTEAQKVLQQGIDVWKSQRSKLASQDDFKISMFEEQARTYRILQRVLIAQNKVDAALEVSESGRARAFVDLLISRLHSHGNVSSATEVNINQIKQIAKLQNATLVQYSIIYDEFTVAGTKEAKESELYIWVIKPTGEVSFRKTDLKTLWQKENTTLNNLVVNSRESIGARGINFRGGINISYNPDTPKATNRLKRLHELLINPIADLLPKKTSDKVIFIPQKSLFLVPFPALQNQDGKYLIEKHTILTSPAIQILDFTRKQKQRIGDKPIQGNNMLIVGNPTMPFVSPSTDRIPQQLTPLPGAEREVKAIANLFKTQSLIGNQATETLVTQRLPQARLIHLATHGLFDDVQGLNSSIALAPGNKENKKSDGLLTAQEILDLKLNAELVVLSACDTGRGRLTGDGVIGLSRSLISAGVPSVLVSLWSVPDSPTASLMTEFYQNLSKNSDKAQALRIAMLTTMKQHPNPRDWAAFTLIGEAQ